MIRRAILKFLWPPYPCERCVGQSSWDGCYCAYHGAPWPGGPGPQKWRVHLRRIARWCFNLDKELWK